MALCRSQLGGLVLLAVCALAAPSTAAVDTLPSRLSDAEFWQLSERLSEPDGAFRSDNLLSNELRYPEVIPDLIARVKPGGVYLGVGPEQNFNYIVALKPRMAFITDVREPAPRLRTDHRRPYRHRRNGGLVSREWLSPRQVARPGVLRAHGPARPCAKSDLAGDEGGDTIARTEPGWLCFESAKPIQNRFDGVVRIERVSEPEAERARACFLPVERQRIGSRQIVDTAVGADRERAWPVYHGRP
jgi:hypothetical protein